MNLNSRLRILLPVAVCGLAGAQDCLAQTPAKIDPFVVEAQTYAALDVSGTTPAGLPVDSIALDDTNQAAFCFTTDRGQDSTQCVVKHWQNGALTATGAQTIPLTIFPSQLSSNNWADYYTANSLTASGKLYGNVLTGRHPYVGYVDQSNQTRGFSAENGSTNLIGPPDPPLHDYTNLGGGNGGGFSLDGGNQNGYWGQGDCDVLPSYAQSGPSYYGSMSYFYIYPTNKFRAFDGYLPIPSQIQGTANVTITHQSFIGRTVNKNGWATGDSYPNYFVWNNAVQQLQSIDNDAAALNDDNDILVTGKRDSATNRYGGAYLIEKGQTGTKRYFLSDGQGEALLPAKAQPHFRNLQPLLMGNRVAAPGDGRVQPVLHMLFKAEVERSPAVWSPSSVFVLRLRSDDTTEVQEVVYPEGVTNVQLKSINASGVIAALGNVGPGEKHALLSVPVEMREVHFGGTKYWELKSDDAATTYTAPHWVDNNGDGDAADVPQSEHNYAVAFTRNTKPKIGARLKVCGLPSGLSIKMRATGPDGIQIPATSPAISGEEITLVLTESSSALVNTIKHYTHKDSAKAFELKWALSFDGGSNWSEVAKTKHTVYVLFADPVTSLRQETLADLGCRNANGENAEAGARGKMYGEFTDRVVKRLDGKQMTYWLSDQMGCTDTPDLLSRQDGNGNCQSWSGLFRDVLRLQGIQADRIRVWPQVNDTSVIVKTWTFTDPPHGPPNHPYVIGTDATDAQGVPGQGNPNPPGSFNGHWITESGGTYYDPSYGAQAVSGANKGKLYEDGAFAGFWATYHRPNSDSEFDSIRKNTTTAQSPAEVNYFEAN